jgi:RNA polymerase sigma-70 factor (ECF subfamily)
MKQTHTASQALDPQTMAGYHDQYYPVIYRYVCYRLQDDQVCEDITSEVFMHLLNALVEGKENIRNVRAWLLGAASNLVNDHLRGKYRKPLEHLDDHEHIAGNMSPEREAEHHFKQRDLRSAMQQLTTEQQNVVALRFSQDMSLNETAQVMGKSLNAVKVLQFRAIAALRRLLEKKWAG